MKRRENGFITSTFYVKQKITNNAFKVSVCTCKIAYRRIVHSCRKEWFFSGVQSIDLSEKGVFSLFK